MRALVVTEGPLTQPWWQAPFLALNLERAAAFHPDWHLRDRGHVASFHAAWARGQLPASSIQRAVQHAALKEWWDMDWNALLMARWSSFVDTQLLSPDAPEAA